MHTYLYTGRYTADGVRGVIGEGGAAREAATRALFESLGGRIVTYGFVMGEWDFVILAEMPSDSAAVVPPMMARATGTVEVHVTRVYSSAEIDESSSLARGVSFRAAGTGH